MKIMNVINENVIISQLNKFLNTFVLKKNLLLIKTKPTEIN
jgi:hypothetical protein